MRTGEEEVADVEEEVAEKEDEEVEKEEESPSQGSYIELMHVCIKKKGISKVCIKIIYVSNRY